MSTEQNTPRTAEFLNSISKKCGSFEQFCAEVEEFASRLERENAALREMLAQRLFFTAGNKLYDRQGYSFTVDDASSVLDINYRNATLYPTADACIDAELKIWMQKPLTEKEV